MENYMGGSDGASLAGSDYQHARPQPPREQQHSQSSYSIMGNEHLRTSSIAEPPLPQEASRQRVTEKSTGQPRPSHKRAESGSIKARTHKRQPTVPRVEALRKASRHSIVAGPSGRNQSPASAHRRSMSKNSMQRMSRQSLTGSVWPSSPPVAAPVRSHGTHKRNVSFQHVRKASGISAPSSAPSISAAHYTPELQARARQSQQEQVVEQALLSSSPTARAAHDAQQRRKSKTPTLTPRSRARAGSADTPNHYMRSQVRKASSELEKACEEAFFRSSYGSMEHTDVTEERSPYNTPPSSVSPDTTGFPGKESYRRPLPALP